jgi:hypothetical protein
VIPWVFPALLAFEHAIDQHVIWLQLRIVRGYAQVLKDKFAEDMYAPRENVSSERGQVGQRIVLVDIRADQHAIRRCRTPLGDHFCRPAGYGLYDAVAGQCR